MRAPGFWHKPHSQAGILPMVLAPFSMLWRVGVARKLRKGPWEKLGVPVICIGNINVGGTGKTPTTIALHSLLLAQGRKVHIVSRGYGGTEMGPIRVVERQHTAAQVGDEPLLMSAFGDVWVAKDRATGARAAIAAGAEIILLDDGFQNPSLHQDLSIVVVDAAIGFGNGRVIPAGPLRETLATGLKRADLIISIGDTAAQGKLSLDWPEIANTKRVQAALCPLQTGMDWRGLRVIAFAGIGRPAKFFQTLRTEGAIIVAAHEFADHVAYSSAVLERLKKEALKNNAQLVTTEKDAARLPTDFRPEVLTLPVRLEFNDPSEIKSALSGLT